MTWGTRRAPRAPWQRTPSLALVIATALAAIAIFTAPTVGAQGDDTARASALFASGNAHLQAAQRLRGDRRTRELEAAITDYTQSLAIVRSRNVLFNASLALEQLGRREDAFNYLSEYLAVPGLSETEQSEASRRIEALRPGIAVLSIRTEPAGAEVWIDRRDLAARGRTPLTIAIPAGEHQLWLRAPGHREAQAHATAIEGQTASATIPLVPDPVRLQVLAPIEHRLSLDGHPIAAGAMLEIAPGPHVIRLESEGLPAIERRVEIPPGGAPMVIDLAPAIAGLGSRGPDATLLVTASEPAQVLIDGLVMGSGAHIEIPIREGEHEIQVIAEGRAPYRASRRFGVGDRAQLSVEMLPRGGALLAPRIAFGVLATLSLIAGVGAAVGVAGAHDSFTRQCTPIVQEGCRSAIQNNNLWALMTDLTWAAAAVFGGVEIILLLVDDGGARESRGSFALAPMPLPGGGGLAARITLGDVL